MISDLERRCIEKGLKMTEHRRVVARVLSEAKDHPNVETVYQRAVVIDARISIATVYRAVNLFHEASVLRRHDFGDGKGRYEQHSEDHHDHLIDMRSGAVVEFSNAAIETLQEAVARELGFRLVGHKLELYAVPLEITSKTRAKSQKTPAAKRSNQRRSG